ncbi:MAG: ABC transporter permease [Vicinamibacterales bacterium]
MTPRRRRAIGDRIYRALLRLFPAEFRGDFGDDMAADFRDQRADARARGVRGLARLWWRTVPRLLATAAVAWIDDLGRDVRVAARILARSPGSTAAAVIMLAVGTGANAVVFGVVNAVVLRMPFADAGRVASVLESTPRDPRSAAIPVGHLPILEASPAFEAVAAETVGSVTWAAPDGPARLSIHCSTAGIFRVLGTPPLLGRTYTPDEDRPGAAPVVVLSHRAWTQRFHADPDVPGRTMLLDGVPATIIGVMPAAFRGATEGNLIDGWVPFGPALDGGTFLGCSARGPVVFVRLADGVSLADAAAQVNATGRLAALPAYSGETGARVELLQLTDQNLGDLRGPFAALVGAVGCLLLIACANVASLHLERLASRRSELAVRVAMGASRGRLVRQVLAEMIVLWGLGAVGGILAARMTLTALVALMPPAMPRRDLIALDVRTLAVTLAVALVAVVSVGLLPAVQATRPDLGRDLKAGGRGAVRGARRTRPALVVLQIAASLTLLIGAGLMVRTFLVLRPSQPGFEATGRVVARVTLPGSPDEAADIRPFAAAVSADLERLPGVRDVAMATFVPMTGLTSTRDLTAGSVTVAAWSTAVTPNFFDALGIRLEAGRPFGPGDVPGAPAVAIVDEEAARRLWPDGPAVGRIVEVEARGGRTAHLVVGVAAHIRDFGPRIRTDPQIYIPFEQQPSARLFHFVVRMDPSAPLPESAIRTAVAAARPGQVVDSIDSLQAIVDRSVAKSRFGAWMFGLLGVLAVVLATLGLAAVVGWWVTERTREIGVRMALGATAGLLTWQVLRGGLVLAVAGVTIGVAGAVLGTRLLATWLYGVTALDAGTFLACAGLMLLVTAVASYVPARRVVRLDPIVTLRAE